MSERDRLAAMRAVVDAAREVRLADHAHLDARPGEPARQATRRRERAAEVLDAALAKLDEASRG